MTETVGFDEQTRSVYPLEAFLDREAETPLGKLYAYWRALPSGAHGLPNQAECLPRRDLPAELAQQVSSIDTCAKNPLEYVIREHAPNPIPGLGVELAGKPLCHRRETDMDTTASAVEFLFCKHERTPVYHEVDILMGGLKRCYTRIMLPVETDSGTVERIFFALRDLQPARRIAFHTVGGC